MMPRLKTIKWLWLVVLAVILTACSASSGGGSPSSVGGAAPALPLPGGEQTRSASSAAKAKPQKTEAPQPQQPAAQNTAAAIPPLPGAGGSGDNPPDPTQPPADTPTAVVANTATPFPTVVLTQDLAVGEFSVQAADGLEITGAVYTTHRLEDRQPGVIILPMDSETRQAWDRYARALARGGFTVLTLDLRGQGETGGAADWQKALDDVGIVWKEFIRHKNVDAEKTALVGAGSGATLALNVAAAHSNVRTVVLVSPVPVAGGLTSNEPLARLGGRKIQVISGESDPISGGLATTMQQLAPDVVTLELLPSGLHGTPLLEAQPQLINSLQKWLQDRFSPPPSNKDRSKVLLYGVFTVLAFWMGLFLLLATISRMVTLAGNAQRNSRPVTIESIKSFARDIDRVELRGAIIAPINPAFIPGNPEAAAFSLEVEKTVDGRWQSNGQKMYGLSFAINDGSGQSKEDRPERMDAGPGKIRVEVQPNAVIETEAVSSKGNASADQLGLLGLDEYVREIDKYQIKSRYLTNGQQVGVEGRLVRRRVMEPNKIENTGKLTVTHTIGALRTKQTAASVSGKICDVWIPKDGNLKAPLAICLMKVVGESDRVVQFDAWHISEFSLETTQGKMLIKPDEKTLELSLNPDRGISLSAADFKARLPLKDLDDFQSIGDGPYQYLVYELRAGDEINITGKVMDPEPILLATRIHTNLDSPPLIPAAFLKECRGRVTVSGVVEIVEAPIAEAGATRNNAPLAVLCLDSQTAPNVRPTSPPAGRATRFWVKDSTGRIRIIPRSLSTDSLGKWSNPSREQTENALKTLGINPQTWAGRTCRLWEIREKQPVTLSGNNITPSGGGEVQPVVELTPADASPMERLKTWRPNLWQVASLLFILGLAMLAFVLSLLMLRQAFIHF